MPKRLVQQGTARHVQDAMVLTATEAAISRLLDVKIEGLHAVSFRGGVIKVTCPNSPLAAAVRLHEPEIIASVAKETGRRDLRAIRTSGG